MDCFDKASAAVFVLLIGICSLTMANTAACIHMHADAEFVVQQCIKAFDMVTPVMLCIYLQTMTDLAT